MHKEDDIHQRTEEALRQSEARFEGILAIAADAIISVDERQRIILFNEGAQATFGYTREEILGEPLDLLIPERYRGSHGNHVDAFGASKVTARRMGERQEIFALRKDGREFPAEASISRLEIDGEKTFTVVLRDVSERKSVEAALRESEERLQVFLDNSSVVGWMKDEAGRYVFLSASFQRRFDVRAEEWIGKTDYELRPRTLAEKIRRNELAVLARGQPFESLEEARNADGSHTWWLSHHFPFRDAKGRRYVGCLGVDITERIKAEEALANVNAALETRVEERTQELRDEMRQHQEAQAAVARLQRMEALGQLTGGVAHDFNNLLTVISGNLQLMSLDIQDPKLLKYLEEAERAAEMGARLNHRLMTFAKQRRLSSEEVNLNDQVIGVRELLRRSLGETIALTTELADDLWTVHVDPSEIENALVNLAINARDAMPEGGNLTVETHNVSLGPDDPRTGEGLAAGDYVVLSVSDTGAGMTREVQARAFEPFFSTKGPGKGTGLGLATIYGFVRQSGGLVMLGSAPGQGTTVDIFLPRFGAEKAKVGDADGEPRPGKPAGETILVVEDNPDVRRVTVDRIEALGYRVVQAESGGRALEILESTRPIDLVFSDVVMPGLSGFELARRIRERWPARKVLLTTGFAAELAAGSAEESKEEILLKPYSQAALERALWRALQGERAPQGESPQTRSTSAVKT